MLKLVLGISGTGKSTHILQEISRRASAGRHSILLVPEQFSSSAENMVYRRLKDRLSRYVTVLSFRTLGERILRTSGGAGLPVLSEAGRVVFVRRALDSVQGRLQMFARQRRSPAFCNLCAQTFSELKTAGCGPDRLQAIAEEKKADKLKELALIFDAYEALIAQSAMDPQDRLCLAAQRTQSSYLQGKACFVDGFDGFTAPEYALLEQLLCACETVWVSLCCSGLHSTENVLDLFYPVRKTAFHLLRLAQKAQAHEPKAAGAAAQAPLVLQTPLRPENAALLGVNLCLAGEKERAQETEPESKEGPSSFYASPAADEWEEMKQVASEIYRLALQGVPYSQMAVICRDVALYERVARRQLGLFGIPYFIDAPTTIEYSAPVAFLRAALGLLQGGLTSRNLLALLKTDLCGFSQEALNALENYVFTWQPTAQQWRSPFIQNPDGLLTQMTEQAQHQLDLAESVRAQLVPKIEPFLQRAKNLNAEGLSRQLYLLMETFEVQQHLQAMISRFAETSETAQAAEIHRAWDLTMDLLDQMALQLGDETVSAREYDELLLLLVRSTDFGQAPQQLESVVVTSADRMRLAEPDYVFIVGVCEGEFPMPVGYSGLLTHIDRDLLVAGGVEMPGSFENRVLLEEMFFYRAFTAARKGLYVSWPLRRNGQPKTPAARLQPLMALFAPPVLQPSPEQLAATPRAAYDLLGAHYREDDRLASSLYEALQQTSHYHPPLRLLDEVDASGCFEVPQKAVLETLVGRSMSISPTQAEQYYNCCFAYYLERILRVRPRRVAVLSPLESGSFVHYVLEQVLREVGELRSCTDETLREAALRHADAFIEQNALGASCREARQLLQMKETLIQLLYFMRDAARQSAFNVDALELEVGGKDMPAAAREIVTRDGHVVRIVGKVDRVDTLQKDGVTWLAIVDYKTGDKKLKLDEVYCGLNIQMVIYMDLLCRDDARYPHARPAAVLYLMSDPTPEAGTREESKAGYRLDGLLLEDVDILHELDNGKNGSFLPVRYNKDGTVRKTKTSPILDADAFEAVLDHTRGLLQQMAEGVYGGMFHARPQVKSGYQSPCRYCPYRPVCRHEDGKNEKLVSAPEDAFIRQQEPAQEGGD